jgi:para-aminobenzoate N-oxygenase AurF
MTLTSESSSRDVTTEERIGRLSSVSLKRVIEPDLEILGTVGPGQVVGDDLLSIAGTDITLDADQRAKLAREEVAAITQMGVVLEGLLTAALGVYVAEHPNLADPRVTYALHEIGEESRHSRLFARLVTQLAPQAKNPFGGRAGRAFQRWIGRAMQRDQLLMTILVLAGEEIPDLIQQRSLASPDTDPFLRQVNQYHRQEEARHVAFARLLLSEFWVSASRRQRRRARRMAPFLIRGLFEILVHPGVYETVGLPGWRTWITVNRSANRVALRQDATRPVLQALIDAGAIPGTRVPRAWRNLTGWCSA